LAESESNGNLGNLSVDEQRNDFTHPSLAYFISFHTILIHVSTLVMVIYFL